MEKTFENGQTIRFNLNGIDPELLKDALCYDAKAHDGKKATIEHFVTSSELGNKNKEFYSVQFEDGMVWFAVNGSHLTLIPDEREKFNKLLFQFLILLLILFFVMIGESLIENFLDYLNSLHP